MFERVRNVVGATAIAAAVVVTPLAGSSAAAAPDAQQAGLVNVSVVDVANHNTILSYNNVPISAAVPVAANVCGIEVQAGVIAQALRQGGTYTCQSSSQAVA